MRSRTRLLTFAVPLTIIAGACFGAWADDSGRGDDRDKPKGDEQLILTKTIDVGTGQKLGAFDISFVDPRLELYILADRTNASVDLFDSEDPNFIGRIGAACPAGNPAPHFCFQGVVTVGGVVNNNLSGPDGDIIVDHKEIWAGDGDSRIKVIDLATKSFVTTISTGGNFRVDEMAVDPRDHLLAAANNADSPPFVTVFDTNAKTIVAKLVFQKGSPNANVDAQNGIEQAQWSPETGLFYISVPQVGTDPSIGGVSVIDPKTNTVTGTFLVKNCSPAGLALGPRHEALLGCSAAFGTPATTKSVIIDITSTDFTLDGAVVATVPIGGSDEVWYDKGTRHYFLAARSNTDATGKLTPILGSIDAATNRLDPSAPSSTTSHSVAADKNSHFVFLPVGLHPATATAPDPNNPCPTNGCIAVYRAQPEHSDDEVAQQ
jgi:DNA-binding beta-propeller fold protein YncE